GCPSMQAITPACDPPGGAATEVWLGDQRGMLARFVLRDTLRGDAQALMGALRERGLRVHLVSGDTPQCCRDWAGVLGISEVLGGASPEDKKHYVAALQAAGRVVLAVGDGVNDAPILGLAQVS